MLGGCWLAVGRAQIGPVQQGYDGADGGISAWAEFWYRTGIAERPPNEKRLQSGL